MTQGNTQNPGEPNCSGKPAVPNHEVTTAINSLGEKYEASQENRAKHDSDVLLWTKRATKGVGLYTLLTLGIAVLTYCALRTSTESNRINRAAMIATTRAWLTPVTAELEDGFAQSGILHFIIKYGNVGKEPAIDFVADQKIGFFQKPLVGESLYEVFPESKIKDDGVCGIRSNSGAGVMYPSALRDYGYEVTYGPKDIKPEDRDKLAAIAKGDQGIFIHGCFAYKAIGVESKSEYCFMRLVVEDVRSHKKTFPFVRCPYGNHVYGGPDSEK
jgi:hypothetical protein